MSPLAEVAVPDAAAGRSIDNGRILIADDEPLSVRLLASILQKQKFKNLRFADGGRALDLVQSFQPDLELLDMQMPDIDGSEVCRQVRSDSNFVDVPILVQTATVNRKEMAICSRTIRDVPLCGGRSCGGRIEGRHRSARCRLSL